MIGMASLSDRTTLATRHVVRGREIVAGQRELIERLRQLGCDTTASRELLAEFERTQAIFEDDLDRLQRMNFD